METNADQRAAWLSVEVKTPFMDPTTLWQERAHQLCRDVDRLLAKLAQEGGDSQRHSDDYRTIVESVANPDNWDFQIGSLRWTARRNVLYWAQEALISAGERELASLCHER